MKALSKLIYIILLVFMSSVTACKDEKVAEEVTEEQVIVVVNEPENFTEMVDTLLTN